MVEALPGKLVDDIKDHCNVLIEDINIIESGYVTLSIYLEMQNQN
ncbi:hypothetical protein MTR67_048042 [Solanum verrucosum]|uniref:Uncharacterized protein n=1 Tax=Solanum verrucosum TaxID=315347 RepID=A0AAF0UY59_SOLVR|nr:hypothetical protein MTR67_048042 [Solanum verrucosum]